MNAFYGHDVTTHSVLRGEVAAPAGADRFIQAVREAKQQEHASN
jgi:lipid-binding SYLF domain-containing protein